jgi:PHD/YefM family antitoxin component YafN of YafNO toxin-antitoxin module
MLNKRGRSINVLDAQEVTVMTTVSSDAAGENLANWIGHVSQSHEPVQITAGSGTAILIAEEDWRAIQETLYLVSVPGMRESIREGLATPLDDCSEDSGW